MSMLENLQKLHAQGQDNALLRYSLGNELFKLKEYAEAEAHLRASLAHDAKYSVAWKILGKTLAADARHEDAVAVFEQGIAVAEEKGDIQAAKEMKVFLKRSRKALDQAD